MTERTTDESAGPPEVAAGGRPLRLALVLHAHALEAWALPILQHLRASERLQLELVVTTPVPPSCAGALFRGYRAFDRRFLGLRPDPHRREEPAAHVGDVPCLALDDWREPPPELGARLAGVDLAIDLTRGTPIPGLATGARLGVLGHPDRQPSGDPEALGFWPIRREVAASESRVTWQRGEAAARVIARAYTSTRMGSLHRNRGVMDGRFAILLIRCLDAIAEGRPLPASWCAEPEPLPPLPERLPGPLDTLGLLLALAGRLLGRKIEQWRFGNTGQRWSIAYRRATPPVDGHFDPEGFRFLHAPPGHFYADPFVLGEGGHDFVFFEDFDVARESRAHLSCVEIFDDDAPSPARRVLACDYHLSYPSLFRHEGALYLLPETSGNRTIEAWRAIDFPERWERAHVLIPDIHAADATLFERDGRWWMFAAVSPDGANPHDELHLFFADEPFGRWQPHPQNPVVADVRRARPAGNVVERQGIWLRPSQDCAALYGRATRLNRIERLSTEDYAETPIGVIEPALWPGGVRTHTLSHGDGWQAIDLSLRRIVGE